MIYNESFFEVEDKIFIICDNNTKALSCYSRVFTNWNALVR